MKIVVEDAVDMITMDLDVDARTLKTTKCNGQIPIAPSLEIKNGGIGIWSFKVDGGKMDIYQNGNSLFSYSDACLMDHISDQIKFPNTDKISNRFRLQQGMILKIS